MSARLKHSRRLPYIVGLPLLFVCMIATAFAFLPADEDTPIPIAMQGGGARQRPTSINGLQAAWPALAPVDAGQAALGRLLFFDPVLSGNDRLACATCHHPDLGFSDGLALSRGAHDEDLRRSAPSLWNVAFEKRLFWDGRADSLEEQMLGPLTNDDEMGADLDEMVTQLATIDEYQRMFGEAFDDGITADNVIAAIAAFERTLISNQSPFDRYAAGDEHALTPAQRRGFAIFRSAQTRCFECHTWPTFNRDEFHVLGVPITDRENPDLGRAEVAHEADARFAFRIPTLRNVALTAPYMHNGSFATLADVIQFYEVGGGAQGIDVRLDPKMHGFSLTTQQKSDLIAFLYSLTDEPPDLIAIPDAVPSGLAVVQHVDNPAREVVEQSTAPPYDPTTPREPQTIMVHHGETIQAGVDRALPGDTVLVEPGVYYENVRVDTNGITLRGLIDGDERAWLDGQDIRSDGFTTSGNDFTLEGFGIRNYVGNGVLTSGAERVVYRDLLIQNTGSYGIYPVECTDVLVERVTASGIADAAIYVGQSRGPIVVRDSELFENVVGIEIENSTDAEVYDNHTHHNTGGILVTLLPNNPSKVGYNTRIYHNLIENNNLPTFAHENAIVGLVPPGTGILIVSADNTEVFDNTIRGNQTGGVGLTSLYLRYSRETVFDVGPTPENNWIHDNHYADNGYAPEGYGAELGLPGADVVWTGDGWNNAFDEPNASLFPPVLPGRSWPDPLRRALWRTYDVAVRALVG
jgi:cytochrome c peroxidase